MKKPLLGFIGGCEFTYLIEELKFKPKRYFPLEAFNSYVDFGETDPYLIVCEHKDRIFKYKPDAIIVSQIEVLTTLVRDIQLNRHNDRAELDRRLDEIIDQCEQIFLMLSELKVPMLLYYFPWPRTGMVNRFKPDASTYTEAQLLRKYIVSMEELSAKYSNFYFMDLSNRCAFHGYNRTLKVWDRPWSAHIVKPAVHIAEEFACWIDYVLRLRKKVKCVLVDLDNTMWQGVIRDIGVEKLEIRRYIERFRWEVLGILHSRGILIGVVSKNDPYLAEQIQEFIRPYHCGIQFASFRLSWDDKWQVIKDVGEELNIGLDSILFIDDNPFEREQVKTMLPEVRVVHENIFEQLLYLPELQPEFVTTESKNRTQYYAQEKQRKTVAKAMTREEFLEKCKFKIEVKKVGPHEINRVTELIQRTNQLNTSIKRYTQDEVITLSRDPNCDIFVVYVSDKFGDYGLVGVCIAMGQNEVYQIDTLLFSCRIMSKGVEDYTLSTVLEYAADKGFDKVMLRFARGPKNEQMRTVLTNNCFVESSSDNDQVVYTFDLKSQQIKPRPGWFAPMQCEQTQAITV